MRKHVRIGIVFWSLCLVSPSFATTRVGILACGHGQYPATIVAGPGGYAGNMITCPMGDLFTSSTSSVTYVQGVCGDQPFGPGNTPCLNYFSFRSELCGKASSYAIDGLVQSSRGWGAYRLCYDPTQVGDCSGPPLSPPTLGTVVLGGSAIFFHQDYNAPTGGGNDTNELLRSENPVFVFPPSIGPNRRITMKFGVGHYTSEPIGASCAGPSCGVSGCIVQMK